MTGKPFLKIRTVLSDRVNSPVRRKDFDAIAVSFKQGIAQTVSLKSFNADISVKAAMPTIGSASKPGDTDGKKRTNTGGTPGMVELPGGYRFVPSQKGGKGKFLQLFPSWRERNSASKTPNFGWIDEPKTVTADEYVEAIKKAPKIRLRKYKIDRRTGDIDESTEQVLDPFTLNGTPLKNQKIYEEKRLPGASLAQRGRSLIARSAAKFGVVVDERNKFRCPPGTPAANQFTDSMGSNCFGLSPSDLVNNIAETVQDISSEDGPKNKVGTFFNFLSWLDNGGIPGIGRYVWHDENGKRIRNIKKWREATQQEFGRTFVNGMVRAQNRLANQDAIIAELKTELGVVDTPENRATNKDLDEVFERLRESGAWSVEFANRMSEADVEKVVSARLMAIPGFDDLPEDRKRSLIQSDKDRWYETERAALEAMLDEFVRNPEGARFVGQIDFAIKDPNSRSMDEASSTVRRLESGEFVGVIRYDIREIMNNQEAMLPQLGNDERLRIDVVGAQSDAQAAQHLTDFLVTVDGYSKQLAAMVEPRAFARHIMKHEIAHSYQIQAFIDAAQNELKTKGSIDVFDLDDPRKKKTVKDFDDLTSGDILSLMMNANDGLDIEAMGNALQKLDKVGFLAGTYQKGFFEDAMRGEKSFDYWAMEASAELWALRDLGIIYGDDIDEALEFFDKPTDSRYIEKAEGFAREATQSAISRKFDTPPYARPRSAQSIMAERENEHNKLLKMLKKSLSDSRMSSDEMIELAGKIKRDRDDSEKRFTDLEKSGLEKDHPDLLLSRQSLQQYIDLERVLQNAWTKRFGSPTDRSRSAKEYKDLVENFMDQAGMLDPEVAKEREKRIQLQNFTDMANQMSEGQIAKEIADIDLISAGGGLTPESRAELDAKRNILVQSYKSLTGGTSTDSWANRKRALDRKVKEIREINNNKPVKKIKRFNTPRSAETHATNERDALLEKVSFKQRRATYELGDTSVNNIGMLLDPNQRRSAADQIVIRHRVLQDRGDEIDVNSRDSASLEDQVQNILMPSMEAIDRSSISEAVEIEAILDVDIDEATGALNVGQVIDHEQMLTGRLISKRNPARRSEIIGADGNQVVSSGKQKRRVVIQAEAGDKALFPSWSSEADTRPEGFEQKATLPPGQIRVVEVREDGTVVAKIDRQDNAFDVALRLSEIPGDSLSTRKVKRSASRYLAQRDQKKMPMEKSVNKRELRMREIAQSDAGFSSGRRTTPAQFEVESVNAQIEKATSAREKVDRLKQAKQVFEETGVWPGGDLQVVMSLARRADGDSIDAETATMKNVTREQFEADGISPGEVIKRIDRKINVAQKEADLQEFLSKSKETRVRQNIVDLEDIDPEEFEKLKEEQRRLQALSPQERFKELQPTDTSMVAVIHVGSDTLEGDALDPTRTIGMDDGSTPGSSGDTASLNLRSLEIQRGKARQQKRELEILESIKANGPSSFQVKDNDDKRVVSSLGFPRAQVGETIDLSVIGQSADDFNNYIQKQIDGAAQRLEYLEKPLKRAEEGGKFGFLSSYPLSDYIVSRGYFGRYARTSIPEDVAIVPKEFEINKTGNTGKINDQFMYERWLNNLRGSAYLVIGKKEEDITEQLGPSGERQIIGRQTPVFGLSARLNDPEKLDDVSLAVMARAVKLYNEGKPVSPASVLGRNDGFSSGRRIDTSKLSSGAKNKTSDILDKANSRGIDIDKQEREVVPALKQAAKNRRLDPGYVNNIKENISRKNITQDDRQMVRNLAKTDKSQLEILREVPGDDSFGQRLDVLEEIADVRGDEELKNQINAFRSEISAMTPDQFDSAVEKAMADFESPFDERPTVLLQDPLGLISQGRYRTVHEGMPTQGGSVAAAGGIDVASVRKVAEYQVLDFPTDSDKELNELRPASAMTLQKSASQKRIDALKEKYGDDVEIQHEGPSVGEMAKSYALTGSGKRKWRHGEQYGRSSVILRPEVAERTLAVNGDSISDVSTSGNRVDAAGARLSNLTKDGELASMFFNPLAVLFESETGRKDTIASASNNPTQRYVEGMVVGSFDLSDVESIVAEPFDFRGDEMWGWGDTAMNFPGVRPEASFTNLIAAARTRDAVAKEHGVDIVIDSMNMPLDEVEPFNASMTEAWVKQKIDSGQWKGVSIEQIVTGKGTTPYEALLRYNKINVENGGQEPFFDHPGNKGANDEKIKENFISMVDEELKRLSGRK